MDPSKCE